MEQVAARRGLSPIVIDPETFLKDHFVLPPMPEVVTRVLQATRSGEATANDVADLLASDPGLVAQILKIVNSAYYGLPRRIAQVKHAVAYLGLSEIERLALTATVMDVFPSTESKHFERFWFHSFYSALISKCLAANHAKSVDAEELHTAVLLHDIGKLVYLKFFPDHFDELLSFCTTRGVTITEAERRLDFPSHAMLGSLLCDRWDLPDVVKRACEQHELQDLRELDESSSFREEIQFVCIANLLCNLASEKMTPDNKSAVQRVTLEVLGCSEQDFLLLMGEVYELKSEAESFLKQA